MVMHLGIVHLVMTQLALWEVGRAVERVVGSASLLAAYLVAGLIGSLASAWWHPYVVCAGSSGAVLGIYGLLVAGLVRGGRSIPREARSRLAKATAAFAVYNAVYWIGSKDIDHAAHLGGFAAGFACGLGLVTTSRTDSTARRLARSAVAIAVAAAALVPAYLLLPKPFDMAAESGPLSELETRCSSLWQSTCAEVDSGRTSQHEAGERLLRDVVQPWEAEHAKLAKAHDLPPKQQHLLDGVVRYMAARDEAWRAGAEGLRDGDNVKIAKVQALADKADDIAGALERDAQPASNDTDRDRTPDRASAEPRLPSGPAAGQQPVAPPAATPAQPQKAIEPSSDAGRIVMARSMLAQAEDLLGRGDIANARLMLNAVHVPPTSLYLVAWQSRLAEKIAAAEAAGRNSGK